MKERPILFSAPMVRAILEGRKTQTRRVVKNQKLLDYLVLNMKTGRIEFIVGEYDSFPVSDLCPYGQSCDRLWVRETWKTMLHSPGYDGVHDDDSHEGVATISYQAGGSFKTFDDLDDKENYEARRGMLKWRPSIHMPRWASRITLEVTGVRVERLQDISDEDAKAEGTELLHEYLPGKVGFNYRQAYGGLWESINGHGSWDANPWVWVVEFKVIS